MKKLMILAVLAIAAVLVKSPFFTGSRKQKEYQKQGMGIVAMSRGYQLICPAFGMFVFGFVMMLIMLASADGAWEEAGGWMALCIVISVVILVICLFCGYAMGRRHILYDDEKILLGRVFKPYIELRWYEISRMEVKNNGFSFCLYDRDGRKCVAADGRLVGYREFYDIAARRFRADAAMY